MDDAADPSSAPEPLAVERVAWLPVDGDAVRLRVDARWRVPPPHPVPRAELAAEVGERRRHRFPALPWAPEDAAAHRDALSLAFLLPAELVAASGLELSLEVGELRVGLPAIAAPDEDDEGGEALAASARAAVPPGGVVVDPAVLADRRARRAEQAEREHARRAEEADRRAAELARRLASAEGGLTEAREEHGRLEAALAGRDRDAAASRQRLHAEERLRLETSEAAEARVRRAEDTVARMREELADARARVRELASEVEDLRRQAAEAQHAAAATDAKRAHLERRLSEAEGRAAGRERGGGRVAPALAAELDVAAAPVEPRPAPPAGAPAALDAGLVAAEERVAESRAAAAAAPPRVSRALHAEVIAGLDELRRERDDARARLVEETEARRRAETLAAELAETAAQAVGAAERRIAEARERAAAARNQLEARVVEVEAEPDVPDAADAPGEPQVPGEADGVAAVLEGEEPVEGPPPEVVEDVAPEVVEDVAPEVVEDVAPEVVEDVAPEVVEPAPVSPLPAPAPWPAAAIRRLARQDPETAGRLIVAALPLQGAAAGRDIDYDLGVGGAWHAVTVRDGQATVERRTEPRDPDRVWFRAESDPASLSRLAHRRWPRRLTAARRVSVVGPRHVAVPTLRAAAGAPLDLGALHDVGGVLDPPVAYRLAAAGIDRRWTRGHDFSFAHEVLGEDEGECVVTVADGRHVLVADGRPQVPVAATVSAPRGALTALLSGRADPAAAGVAIGGDAAVVERFLGWTRAVQGLEPAPG